MKKLSLLILIGIISIFIASCGSHFNPRYYYNRNGDYNGGGNKPVDPPKPPPTIPEDQDPFKKPPYNNPDYSFPAEKFDRWLFKVSFQGDKLPIYEFFEEKDRAWQSGGTDWKNNQADFYNARDGENKVYGSLVGTVNITGMKIYKYNKMNPLYDSIGYLPGRMDRFRFYSIDGKASITTLRQYLIAVDTYSKFVFAYGAITKVDNVAGEKVPADFEAIEYYADKKHFYEYDPIGYVDSTGKVILYQHYKKEFVASPTTYVPKQHGFDKVAEHDPQKQGCSPYVPINDEAAPEDDQKKYYEDIASLVGKEYKWRDYVGYQKSPTGEKDQINLEEWKQAGYAGKSLILYTYQLTDGGKKLTIKETHFETSNVATKEYSIDKITATNKASYKTSNGDTVSITIQELNKVKTISISGNILDENFQDYGPIFVDRVRGAKFTFGSIKLPPGSTYVPGAWGTVFGGTIKDIVYQFNNDGTEFTLTYKYDGKPYTYQNKLARFDSDIDNMWTAKYQSSPGGSLGQYLRIVLRNNDQLVRSSMTLHSIDFWESPDSDAGLEMKANRVK